MEDYLVLDWKFHQDWSSSPHIWPTPLQAISWKVRPSQIQNTHYPLSHSDSHNSQGRKQVQVGTSTSCVADSLRQVPFTGKAGCELQLCYEALITWRSREASPAWKEPFAILESSTTAMMSWYDYVRPDIWPGQRMIPTMYTDTVFMASIWECSRHQRGNLVHPCIFHVFSIDFTSSLISGWYFYSAHAKR